MYAHQAVFTAESKEALSQGNVLGFPLAAWLFRAVLSVHPCSQPRTADRAGTQL